ncbi:MAG: hypothetical protein DWQ05_01715 [Calditrichaeota bacterium]|nr:MAG: hypothetical protein DWQ05_01715 [Calditrichota bacterium]
MCYYHHIAPDFTFLNMSKIKVQKIQIDLVIFHVLRPCKIKLLKQNILLCKMLSLNVFIITPLSISEPSFDSAQKRLLFYYTYFTELI